MLPDQVNTWIAVAAAMLGLIAPRLPFAGKYATMLLDFLAGIFKPKAPAPAPVIPNFAPEEPSIPLPRDGEAVTEAGLLSLLAATLGPALARYALAKFKEWIEKTKQDKQAAVDAGLIRSVEDVLLK